MNALEMKDLKKTYQKGELAVEALRGINLRIAKGEFSAIVGPSGSGKTTLLNIIGCLDAANEGKVIYDGTDLSEYKEQELSDYRKERIAFVFQSYNLIPVFTVLENVELPLILKKSLTPEERRQKAMEMIEAVGLSGMAHRLPREISGGQEQRVAIARALVKDPLLVLADEPTANLDSETAEEIIDLMKKINRDKGTTFLFSTHDLRLEKHARRILQLKDGLIAADEQKEEA